MRGSDPETAHDVMKESVSIQGKHFILIKPTFEDVCESSEYVVLKLME